MKLKVKKAKIFFNLIIFKDSVQMQLNQIFYYTILFLKHFLVDLFKKLLIFDILKKNILGFDLVNL